MDERIALHLEQMSKAVSAALSFVEGMTLSEFLQDTKSQHAVAMSLLTLGEAASRLAERHPEFIAAHPDMPWNGMRGMRNRIAHGYYEINMHVVWETVHAELPRVRDALVNLR